MHINAHYYWQLQVLGIMLYHIIACNRCGWSTLCMYEADVTHFV